MPCSTCEGQKKQLFLGNRTARESALPFPYVAPGDQTQLSRLQQAPGATEPSRSDHAVFSGFLLVSLSYSLPVSLDSD